MTNVLECFLYHRTATEACEETLVELIDYCYRKFVTMVGQQEAESEETRNKVQEVKDIKAHLDMDPLKDLQRQFDEIEFSCTMTCLSLIRFITDHMESLPASIIHQMMENTDIPLVLVPLLDFKPWIRTNAKGIQEKFEDNRWAEIKPHEKGRITKLEGQIWLSIYNMFMTQASN